MIPKNASPAPAARTPRAYTSLTIITLLTLAHLTACSKSDQTNPAKAAPAEIIVSVINVAPKPVPILIDAVGRTEGSKDVEVRARVSGIVQKQLYTEGEIVRANAPLYRIERAPFESALAQAKAALNQDRAKLEQAQRDNARLLPLVAKRAISQREADDSSTNLKQVEAAILSSEARVRDAELNLSYTDVTAPISGVTGRSLRSEGSLVNAGTENSLLTTLTQTNPVWVRFSLSESEHAVLRAQSTEQAEVRLLMGDEREYPNKGKLNFAGSTVDSRLGTVQLRAEFANPDLTLLPGQFVKTQLILGLRDAIVVPQSAVTQNDQGRFVWIVGPDSKAVRQKVETGPWVGRDWVINSGLKAGDVVIVDNLIKLKPGTPVRVEAPKAPAPAAAAAPAVATDKKS